MADTARILVVDNYDSFVYTLVGYLQELGAETTVVRNDDVTLAEAQEMAASRDGVLISPGPGTPAEAGVCVELILWCGEHAKPHDYSVKHFVTEVLETTVHLDGRVVTSFRKPSTKSRIGPSTTRRCGGVVA